MKGRKSRLDFLFVYAEAGLSPVLPNSLIPPLGMIQIATFLKDKGFRCKVLDARNLNFNRKWFSAYIREHNPRFIGFGVLTDMVFTIARLIKIARRASPNAKIVVGGAHATICDEDMLLKLKTDVVVRGEGELPCLDLARKKELSKTKGISFLARNKLVRNPIPSPIDLDTLPTPDYSLIEGHEKFQYELSIVSGRGCPYRCTFCVAGSLGRAVRWRSVDKVIEDIVTLRSSSTKNGYITIMDDTFTIDANRVAEFCDKVKMIGGGKEFYWYAEGRVDRLAKHPELIKMMREAGLIVLQFGVESGDERVLAAYHKGIRIEDALALTKACADERIFMPIGFIVGGPFESPETLAKTEAVAKEIVKIGNGYASIQCSFLNPLPGTDIFMHPGKFGLKLLDPQLLTSTGFDNSVTETDAISSFEIHAFRMRVMKEIISTLYNTIKARGDEFKIYAKEMMSITGPSHLSMSMAFLDDIFDLYKRIMDSIRAGVKSHSQFSLYSYGEWSKLVHIRLPMIELDTKGNYHSVILNMRFTEDESAVLRYSSGKLTGREIAKALNLTEVEITPTFLSLEEKGAVVYRQF